VVVAAAPLYGSPMVTPHGALYWQYDNARSVYAVSEWHDGTTLALGDAYPEPEVAGGYALLTRPGGVATLVLRDLNTNAEATVVTDATAGDVAPNGDVVYYDNVWGAVYRYRAGTTTQMSTEAPGVTVANPCPPLTDGARVAYTREGTGNYVIHVTDGTTAEVFSAAQDCGRTLLAGEWTIFPRGYPEELWRRGSAGEALVATGIDYYAPYPRALAPDGTVVYDLQERRYRAVPGSAPEDIGSTLGWVLYRDGQFLVLVGGSVLRVLP
jgi:hypothetical protein